MDLLSQVSMLGGVVDRRTLVRLRSAPEVDAALREGRLVRDARGRYALPSASRFRRAANALTGTLSHRSAAHHWGWAQKSPDGLPEVTVPRNRRVDRQLRTVLIPHWSDLGPDDVEGQVTTRRRTLVDCMRNLPFDDALSIADSALRAGDITPYDLVELALGTRGRGRARIIAVAEAASGKAANAFESTLRGQALQVPGLQVVPQYDVPVPGSHVVLHPDLADPRLMIVIEAEGFEWHGDRRRLSRDCRRYNTLSLLGWTVIRFSWSQVMHEPAYVQRVLRAAVRAAEHANVARAA